MLLLHGLGATQYEWPPALLAEIAAAFEQPVVTLDHAGIGGSSFLDTTIQPSIAGLANATAAFIQALAASEPETFLPVADVLGYSMGGMVAQTLLAAHPSSVHASISGAGELLSEIPLPGKTACMDFRGHLNAVHALFKGALER